MRNYGYKVNEGKTGKVWLKNGFWPQNGCCFRAVRMPARRENDCGEEVEDLETKEEVGFLGGESDPRRESGKEGLENKGNAD